MAKQDISLDADERLALVNWYIDQNHLDKALLEIKSLLADDQNDEVLLTGARLYAQLRLLERSQALFTQYLKSNPDAIHVRFQLGMAQFDDGDNQSALKTWESVLSGEVHHPPALFYSAIALLQDGDSDKAIASLQLLLQKTPIDNLYYGQAKDLIAKLERDPNFREKIHAGESFANNTIAVKDVYSTEH